MKKLYLHIGMDKTGTSAIQKFIVDNSNAIEEKYSTYYIKSGQSSDYAHNDLAFSLFEQNGQKLEDLEVFLRNIKKEIEQTTCENIIISSECLFKAYRAKNFKLFLEFIKDNFHDVSIIVYIRNQYDWIVSRHKHSVTSGNTIEVAQLIKPWFCNYKMHVDEWKSCLKLDKVNLRVYDKKQFTGGDIYTDFLKIINTKASSYELSLPCNKVNDSMDNYCVEIKKSINKLNLSITDINSFNENLISISKNENNINSYLSVEDIEYIKNEYHDINLQLLHENSSSSYLDLHEKSKLSMIESVDIPEDLIREFVDSFSASQAKMISSSRVENDELLLTIKKMLNSHLEKTNSEPGSFFCKFKILVKGIFK